MILIDTSIWIEFFKGNKEVQILNNLIENNNICINSLILTELIPSIVHKKENHLKSILESIRKLDLNIDWNDLIFMQSINLKNGINKVGVPDLIIAQNAKQNNVELFTKDGHFNLMSKFHEIKIYEY